MFPSWQDHYINAYRFAALAHDGQKVPGTGIPYLMHLSLVSMEVIASFAVEPACNCALAVQCALLHDVIEDTPTSYDLVHEVFGKDVADGVAALTKDEKLPTKQEQMADSLRRIREQPAEVWRVKLADRITNLQPPPSHWSTEKKLSYRSEAVTILDALGAASPYLAERLQAKIAAYAEHIDSRAEAV